LSGGVENPAGWWMRGSTLSKLLAAPADSPEYLHQTEGGEMKS